MPNRFDRLKNALADHYAIQEELGEGGMATVYLAEDLKHKRKVAVKVLRPELAAVLGALHEFLAKTPLSEPARKDIARLYEDRVDYLPGRSLAEKAGALRRMSYLQFLTDLVKIDAGVMPYFQTWRQGYWGIGNDALPAEVARVTGFPGFQGMGFSDSAPSEGVFPVVTPTSDQYFRFPDGNASIARLLVRSMIPATAPGSSAEDRSFSVFVNKWPS